MIATSFQEDTAGFLAAAALERYEEHLGTHLLAPLPGTRFRLCCDVEAMRQFFLQLPLLWAPWMAVLISHHELLQALDDAGRGQGVRGALGRHTANLARLARACRRLCERTR